MSWVIIGGYVGRKVLCRCSCGVEQYVDKYNLRNGTTTQCRKCQNLSRIKPYSKKSKYRKTETFLCLCGRSEIRTLGDSVSQCKHCRIRSFTCSVPKEHYIRLSNKVKSAIKRCTDPTHAYFSYYGGRGITVWEEWVSNPSLFIEYLASLPGYDDDSLELDRENNNSGYIPGNLRFVDHSTSMRNRRPRRRNALGRFLPSDLFRE